jgi:alpha-tubulin suppressor-like RCC1 family protein
MGKITINELSNSLKDYIKDKQDITDNSLETNNKTIVGAINELVQNSIQNSNKIEEIKNRLYNLMIDNSYNVDSDTTYNELIDILKNEDINPCKIKQISGGGTHTMILMKSGELWSCGYNNYRQLGLGSTTTQKTFTYCLKNVEFVACGYNFTFVIKTDGTLWSCGRNNKGQLGLGNTTDVNYFEQVTSDVKFVSCGYDFTYIIKNDGTLWSCGDGTDYKTGHGTSSENLTEFTQVTANGISNDIKYVACNKGTSTVGHVMIIKNNNTLWGVGNSEKGQLGSGSFTGAYNGFIQVATDVEQVCCGKDFSIIKKLDKTLWFTGNDVYTFVGSSSGTHSAFKQMNGTIDEDVLDIMCGSQHFFYREKAETGRINVWSKGENGDGQLGIGSTTDSKSFNQITQTPMSIVSCGWSNSFLVTKTGNIWVAGLNGNGQLGLNSTTDKTSFTKIDLPGKTIY